METFYFVLETLDYLIGVGIIVVFSWILLMALWHFFNTKEHIRVFLYEPYLIVVVISMIVLEVHLLFHKEVIMEMIEHAPSTVFITRPLILLIGIGLLSIINRNKGGDIT